MTNPIPEEQLRAMVRLHHQRTGRLDLYQAFPLASVECGTCLDEAEKIQKEIGDE